MILLWFRVLSSIIQRLCNGLWWALYARLFVVLVVLVFGCSLLFPTTVELYTHSNDALGFKHHFTCCPRKARHFLVHSFSSSLWSIYHKNLYFFDFDPLPSNLLLVNIHWVDWHGINAKRLFGPPSSKDISLVTFTHDSLPSCLSTPGWVSLQFTHTFFALFISCLHLHLRLF